MNANLMHASGERFAEHNAGDSVEAELLELCGAVFALRRHFAHPDFVGDHFNWLLAFDNATR